MTATRRYNVESARGRGKHSWLTYPCEQRREHWRAGIGLHRRALRERRERAEDDRVGAADRVPGRRARVRARARSLHTASGRRRRRPAAQLPDGARRQPRRPPGDQSGGMTPPRVARSAAANALRGGVRTPPRLHISGAWQPPSSGRNYRTGCGSGRARITSRPPNDRPCRDRRGG